MCGICAHTMAYMKRVGGRTQEYNTKTKAHSRKAERGVVTLKIATPCEYVKEYVGCVAAGTKRHCSAGSTIYVMPHIYGEKQGMYIYSISKAKAR